MKVSQSLEQADNALIDDVERYEVIDSVRVEQEPMGAFETMLASWLCYLINSFAAGKKLGRAVNEMLFILDASRDLKRRPDVAFVSYARWPATVIAREAAWNALPDLAVEIVSPTNLAEEIDNKITDYFQAQVRQVWVVYPDSGRVYELALGLKVGAFRERVAAEVNKDFPTWKAYMDRIAAVK